MPRLRATIQSELPDAETERRLADLVGARSAGERDARLVVSVPVNGRAEAPGFRIHRRIVVCIQRGIADGTFDSVLALTWMPEGPLPVPSFCGALVVRGDDRCSVIELNGTYTQPIGIGGEPFDPAIGDTIARNTAQAVLLQLKGVIENASGPPSA